MTRTPHARRLRRLQLLAIAALLTAGFALSGCHHVRQHRMHHHHCCHHHCGCAHEKGCSHGKTCPYKKGKPGAKGDGPQCEGGKAAQGT